MKGTLNNVILLGNVIGFGEFKNINNLSIAEVIMETYRKKGSQNSGTMQVVADEHHITAFGKNADFCRDNLQIGDKILVEASLQSNSWEGRNGEKRTGFKIVAGKIEPLTTRKQNNHQPERRNQQPDNFDQDIPF